MCLAKSCGVIPKTLYIEREILSVIFLNSIMIFKFVISQSEVFLPKIGEIGKTGKIWVELQ